MVSAGSRPLCPRCEKLPVAEYGGMGPRPKFCGERSCYERSYEAKRVAAKALLDAELTDLALQGERKRLNKEMHRKVAAVAGVGNSQRRITEPLPRGGALVILSGREREVVLRRLADPTRR